MILKEPELEPELLDGTGKILTIPNPTKESTCNV